MAKKLSERTPVAVAVVVLLGVSLILAGAAELLGGGLHYRNYWGGHVFAPFAIGAGLILFVIAVFGWRRANERPPTLRGKAARRARQAEATRFPIDDFDKPWNP